MEPTRAVWHVIIQIHPEGLYCKNSKERLLWAGY